LQPEHPLAVREYRADRNHRYLGMNCGQHYGIVEFVTSVMSNCEQVRSVTLGSDLMFPSPLRIAFKKG
jgi:hypothetical protein